MLKGSFVNGLFALVACALCYAAAVNGESGIDD
jgi:hypothetical protein